MPTCAQIILKKCIFLWQIKRPDDERGWTCTDTHKNIHYGLPCIYLKINKRVLFFAFVLGLQDLCILACGECQFCYAQKCSSI